MKKYIIDVTGCWIGTVADSSLVQWFDHILFYFHLLCVHLAGLLRIYFHIGYPYPISNKYFKQVNCLSKWINNVTPINPCLTSCTRLFDMLFIKIEIRHISNSCKISVKNWNWIYLKIYFQFLFSFALTYYN